MSLWASFGLRSAMKRLPFFRGTNDGSSDAFGSAGDEGDLPQKQDSSGNHLLGRGSKLIDTQFDLIPFLR